MRKTISTKKNFLTGEFVELEKMKPVAPIRGVTTVQLFNEDGNLIEETKSENYVSKIVEEAQKQRMREVFCLTAGDKGTGSGGERMISYKKLFNDYYQYNPISRLLLTNYEGAEDRENERLVKGLLIGQAYKIGTYSGDDTLMGTINTSESFSEKYHLHYVFDFPTSSANGTFSSVYFSYSSINYWAKDIEWMEIPDNKLPEGVDTSYECWKMKKIGSYYYLAFYKGSSTVIGKYNININTKSVELIDSYKVPLGAPTGSSMGTLIDFTIVNDIVLVTRYYSQYLYAYNKDGTTNSTFFSKYSDGSLSSGAFKPNNAGNTADNPGILFHENKLYLILGYKNKNGYGYSILHVYDTVTGTLLNIYTYDWGMFSSKAGNLCYDDLENCFYFDNGYTIYYFNEEGRLTKNLPQRCSMDGVTVYGGRTGNYQNLVRITSTTDNNSTYKYIIRRIKLGSFGTRNLLPSPVTKTKQNTMKITYDFYFEEDEW